eukprot:PhF_6_TR28091/c0_g1_i1/m.41514/K17914/KIF13; kinesin family member 13
MQPAKLTLDDDDVHSNHSALSERQLCLSMSTIMSPLTKKRRNLNGAEEAATISAWVRVRPLNERETQASLEKYGQVHETLIIEEFTNSIQFCDPIQKFQPKGEAYVYDGVLGPESQQDDVYACVGQRLVGTVLNGYNATLLAFGQTSSGKTHTMIGTQNENVGIIPRLIENLINATPPIPEATISMKVSFLEIYNEKVRDLLNLEAGSLRIRQHPIHGVFVDGSRRIPVQSLPEFLDLMKRADEFRVSACTKMNYSSSRSHMIVVVQVQQIIERLEMRKDSQIHLVDLAGSERIKASGSSGVQLVEAQNINLSLTTLRRVIDTIIDSQSGKKSVVPYRESVLTYLISESWGGNSHTTMIATVTPSPDCAEDTMGTLRYAQRARMIVNRVRQNSSNSSKMMEVLQQEVVELQNRLLRDTSMAGEAREELNARIAMSEREMEDLKNQVHVERENFRKTEEQLREALVRVDSISSVEALLRNEISRMYTKSETEQELIARLERENGALTKKYNDLVKELDQAAVEMDKELIKRDRTIQDFEISDKAKSQEIERLNEELAAVKKSAAEYESANRMLEATLLSRSATIGELEKQMDILRHDLKDTTAALETEKHQRAVELANYRTTIAKLQVINEEKLRHDLEERKAESIRYKADCDQEVNDLKKELDNLQNQRKVQGDLWHCRESAYIEQLAQLRTELSSLRETVHIMEEEKHYYLTAMKVGSDKERGVDQLKLQWSAEKKRSGKGIR